MGDTAGAEERTRAYSVLVARKRSCRECPGMANRRMRRCGQHRPHSAENQSATAGLLEGLPETRVRKPSFGSKAAPC